MRIWIQHRGDQVAKTKDNLKEIRLRNPVHLILGASFGSVGTPFKDLKYAPSLTL